MDGVAALVTSWPDLPAPAKPQGGSPVDRDDLLKMLDLSGKEAAEQELATELAITSTTGPPQPRPATSPTALKLDHWGLRRGSEILADSERLQQTGLDENAIADMHGAAFEPDPQLQEDCADPRRREFLAQLLQTPDYHALHQSTMLNAAASAIAATSFAEQFAALKKEEGKDASMGKGKEALDREMATLRAVGRAVSEASKEVQECKEAAAAMGMGPGAPGSNDPKTIAAIYRRVRNNPTLRRICELAGRYRRVAQSKQRQKATHGMDDMVGVVLDGDLGKLLPHELAKLALPEFEDDTLRRLVERQVQCREYRSTEPVAKGPILPCVDESSSMSGEKANMAKAIALTLAWIARMQKRWCGLCAYSGDSGERLLALPPGRWDEAAVMDWLEKFIGYGSTLDIPIRELPDYYRRLGAPAGKTDVILITDAICRIPPELQSRFLAWKQSVQARVIALIIESKPGDLAAISDEVHLVGSLAVSEAGVELVLSV
jgi:uncharacterized protein with von Willebrand factor type A (vWA) domain